VTKKYLKNNYKNKLWWNNVYSLLTCWFLLLVIGLTIYIILIIVQISSTCTSTTTTVTNTVTIQPGSIGATSTYKINPGINYTNPIIKIYNMASNYISNTEVQDSLVYVLNVQIQRDLPNIWGITGTVGFNASTSQTIFTADGTWPLLLMNRDLGLGLGFHTISEGPVYNPSFASTIPSNIPFIVIEIPVICTSGKCRDFVPCNPSLRRYKNTNYLLLL
jgi:hypothetical protein